MAARIALALGLVVLDLHMPGSQDLFGLITVREKFSDIPVGFDKCLLQDIFCVLRVVEHLQSKTVNHR